MNRAEIQREAENLFSYINDQIQTLIEDGDQPYFLVLGDHHAEIFTAYMQTSGLPLRSIADANEINGLPFVVHPDVRELMVYGRKPEEEEPPVVKPAQLHMLDTDKWSAEQALIAASQARGAKGKAEMAVAYVKTDLGEIRTYCSTVTSGDLLVASEIIRRRALGAFKGYFTDAPG